MAWLGVGGLAALGGVAWRVFTERAGGQDLPPDFWQTRLRRLDGTDLSLAEFRGRPLVINFWATWCAPCLREMPALERFHQAQSAAGWTVLGIAVDREEAVREFLGKRPVRYPIALSGWAGVELSRALGNPQGSLPFTAIVTAPGRLAHTRLGEASDQEMQKWPELALSAAK